MTTTYFEKLPGNQVPAHYMVGELSFAAHHGEDIRLLKGGTPFTPLLTDAQSKALRETGKVHHRADIARWIHLYRHGGVIVDLDILWFRPLPAYLMPHEDDQPFEGFAAHWLPGWNNAIVSCEPRHLVLERVMDYIASHVSRKSRSTCFYGPRMLAKVCDGLKGLHPINQSTIRQGDWGHLRGRKSLVDQYDDTDYIEERAAEIASSCVGLNVCWRKSKEVTTNYTRLMESPTLLGQLCRIAMKKA